MPGSSSCGVHGRYSEYRAGGIAPCDECGIGAGGDDIVYIGWMGICGGANGIIVIICCIKFVNLSSLSSCRFKYSSCALSCCSSLFILISSRFSYLSFSSLCAFIIASNMVVVVLSAFSILVNFLFFFDGPADDNLLVELEEVLVDVEVRALATREGVVVSLIVVVTT